MKTEEEVQGVPKKVDSWKNGHIYLQTNAKLNSWESFVKFRMFATRWALRSSKFKKKEEKEA